MATILINDHVNDELTQALEKNHIVINTHYTHELLIEKIQEVDVIVVKSKTKITKDILDASMKTKKLKLIIRAGVGLDNIDLAYAKALGIQVRNTPKASTNAVAELVLLYMLLMSRNIITANQQMHQGIWDKSHFMGSELSGKTLGIIGLGKIGMRLAKMAEVFNMTIMYYDPFQTHAMYQKVHLEVLLEQSDFISLHLPSIGEPLIKKEHLIHIKKQPKIINLSRGDVIEEAFILEGLRSKKISHVALDVFRDEPNINAAFKSSENIYLSPHIGAQTIEAQQKISQEIVSMIHEVYNHA